MQLKNKTAIVTGAGQGIGLGIALALAQEGANVVITDINGDLCTKAAAELKSQGFDSLTVTCNVASKSDIDNLISKTIEKYGTIDILVNNAGIYPYVPFEQMTEADWDKVMNVNMKGVFFATSAALKHMKSGGRIITISSIASIVGFENLVHYCASKGGVNGFTRALALEMAPKGITVNAVAPGAISTPGAAMPEDQKAAFSKIIPAQRFGTPADIAGAVVYLASESANYVTGQVITVDGGWTIK